MKASTTAAALVVIAASFVAVEATGASPNFSRDAVYNGGRMRSGPGSPTHSLPAGDRRRHRPRYRRDDVDVSPNLSAASTSKARGEKRGAAATSPPPLAAQLSVHEPSPPPLPQPSPRMANFLERAPPAIAMAALAFAIIKYGGENGIVGLVLVMQMAMYAETCSIVEDYHYKVAQDDEPTLGSSIEKWWWFLTVASGTSLRDLVMRRTKWNTDKMDLITYGMGVVGLLGAVIEMAGHAGHGPDAAFRAYLGKIAACHFSLFFLVGQSSFWIKTVHDYGIMWVIFPALLVIVNDTMAYIFGVLAGKHKLLPRLSPKKTVEGFLGAALSTVAVSVPLLSYMLGEKSLFDLASATSRHALALAAFASIVSPFGGFLASAVKRAHGAKDFGTLIPGHGGVVDRFDCQVVTAPFVYFYLRRFLSKKS